MKKNDPADVGVVNHKKGFVNCVSSPVDHFQFLIEFQKVDQSRPPADLYAEKHVAAINRMKKINKHQTYVKPLNQ
jgi:hypothetical protein